LWQSLLSAMVTSGHRDSHIKMGSLHLSTIRQETVASGHDSIRPAAARLIDEKAQKHLLYGDDDMRHAVVTSEGEGRGPPLLWSMRPCRRRYSCVDSDDL
jgi:hypothetical protein